MSRFQLPIFFDAMRHMGSGGKITTSQVEGFENIICAWEEYAVGVDVRFIAYSLATTWHETAFTMQPIAEYGKGAGKRYGLPAGQYGHVYYGRGYVQLTWLENYRFASKALGVDLVKNPDLAMRHDIAAKIMIEGMVHGWFTKRKLSHYFTKNKTDYEGARRIINGTDKAQKIAEYAEEFEKALLAADSTQEQPRTVQPKPLAKTRTAKSLLAGLGASSFMAVADQVQVASDALNKVTTATGLSLPMVGFIGFAALAAYLLYLKWDDNGRQSLKEIFGW